MNKKKIKYVTICCICACVMGIGMPVIANTSSRRANIKSTGNLDFENGKVYFASSDLTYLADEIDHLEDTYKQTTVDALNEVGTYFFNDGTITHDFSLNEVDTSEEKSALSFAKITDGIKNSQSVQSLEQIQATDDEGNLLYYETEEAQANKDLFSLTTTDTGFPAYYQAANANNLSAGTAAWVDGTLIKGNGSDNAAYIDTDAFKIKEVVSIAMTKGYWGKALVVKEDLSILTTINNSIEGDYFSVYASHDQVRITNKIPGTVIIADSIIGCRIKTTSENEILLAHTSSDISVYIEYLSN